jgi:hypothetical protein
MLFFKNVIPLFSQGQALRMQESNPVRHSCGSRNPEISKCDFICIYLYWFPAYAGTSLDSCFRRNDDLIPGMTA